MITIKAVYVVTGLLFVVFAVLSARDTANPKRWTTGLFWGLFALSFLAGDLFGTALQPIAGLDDAQATHANEVANGVLVLLMALIVGTGGLGTGKIATTSADERQAGAQRRGNWLFVPALVIPVVTLAGTIAIKGIQLPPFLGEISLGPVEFISWIADPEKATLISLGAGAVLAAALAMTLFAQPPASPFQEGRRLMDVIGWAALLPQMLASLGAVFAAAGVGKIVGDIAAQWVPADNLMIAVVVYCVGMAAFTMIMGNAFAAFPVLTAGVGIPFLIQHFHGDPAAVAAIGMLSGFCGTLMTPLAANFNIVPAALLELKNRNGVILAQIPTALVMLAINTGLMYVLAFR